MSTLIWCSNCTKRQPTEKTGIGHICCTGCGKVLEQDIYSNEATFVKDASGQSRLAGNYVKSVQSEISESRERTLNKAYDKIMEIADNLGVGGGDQIARPALALYTLALERNFTRGRRADQVAACCLYIECQQNKKPFLLIEFAEYLIVNVYVLGAVFLQLCRLLRLEEHPIVRKPVDPSLFIHRFTNVLLGEMDHAIEKTALRIMASMKQNWMQTGRKPSGLFGAALYISALSHGRKFSKSDIGKIVHVCEDTLRKRLIEFEDTESGSLTIEELNEKAEELERMRKSNDSANNDKSVRQDGELLCAHKDSGSPHFAHGLCESCYEEFIEISGGLDGGAEPPAFQRAERKRMAIAYSEVNAADSCDVELPQISSKTFDIRKDTNNHDIDAHERVEKTEARDGDSDCTQYDSHGDNAKSAENGDEPESFGDIDDDEVDKYFYSEEEKPFVKEIWEELNREYVQEQEAKEAAAKAAYEAEMAFLRNCTPEELAKRELAATAAANAAANAAKLKKERQKRNAELKKPKTATEATLRVLTKKRLSSKVNMDVLKNLLDENDDMDNSVSKKSKSCKFQSDDYVMSTISEDVEGEDNLGDLDGEDEYYHPVNNVQEDDYNYDVESFDFEDVY